MSKIEEENKKLKEKIKLLEQIIDLLRTQLELIEKLERANVKYKIDYNNEQNK